METLRKIWRWLGDDPHQLIGVRVLQIVLSATLLFNAFTLLPFATFLWGPHGIGWASTKPLVGSRLGNFFDLFFQTDARVLYVLAIIMIGSLLLFTGYNTFFANLVILMAFSLFYIRLPEITDGGDNIIRLTLIYMLFLLPNRAKFSSGQFRVWLHNIGVLAIAFQLVIIYFIAGFSKVTGESWPDGTALYYITQVQWFTLPGANALFTNPWVVTLATYSTLFYELLFPVAIISRVKLPWIYFGILFHIVIAVLMGMISFAMVMIGLDLFLISDQEYMQIWKQGCLLHKKVVSLPARIHQTFSKREHNVTDQTIEHDSKMSPFPPVL
jgi:hypothetical protein